MVFLGPRRVFGWTAQNNEQKVGWAAASAKTFYIYVVKSILSENYLIKYILPAVQNVK